MYNYEKSKKRISFSTRCHRNSSNSSISNISSSSSSGSSNCCVNSRRRSSGRRKKSRMSLGSRIKMLMIVSNNNQNNNNNNNNNERMNSRRRTATMANGWLQHSEFSLQAQRPEQSVMQALESLSDSQVNDFLSGKAPLNLTMRLGDHMMLIQLQLSTVTPATTTSIQPGLQISTSSAGNNTASSASSTGNSGNSGSSSQSSTTSTDCSSSSTR